jgi:hypothetical protein
MRILGISIVLRIQFEQFARHLSVTLWESLPLFGGSFFYCVHEDEPVGDFAGEQVTKLEIFSPIKPTARINMRSEKCIRSLYEMTYMALWRVGARSRRRLGVW